jgi:hypothetical protein
MSSVIEGHPLKGALSSEKNIPTASRLRILYNPVKKAVKKGVRSCFLPYDC